MMGVRQALHVPALCRAPFLCSLPESEGALHDIHVPYREFNVALALAEAGAPLL
jgi:hypothetical protein